MRKLILKMDMSLDGYVGHGDGDPGWLLQYHDEEVTDYQVSELSSAGVHAMGRGVYEEMAPHWQASDGPIADAMNGIPKAVFSRSPFEGTWPTTTVHRGDLASEIGALKDQDGGPVLAHGGSRFAQSLTQANLIDEYHLLVHPITLGQGLPLFGGPLRLRLTETRTFPRGSALLTYTRLSDQP